MDTRPSALSERDARPQSARPWRVTPTTCSIARSTFVVVVVACLAAGCPCCIFAPGATQYTYPHLADCKQDGGNLTSDAGVDCQALCRCVVADSTCLKLERDDAGPIAQCSFPAKLLCSAVVTPSGPNPWTEPISSCQNPSPPSKAVPL
jgi:hypothetical protein